MSLQLFAPGIYTCVPQNCGRSMKTFIPILCLFKQPYRKGRAGSTPGFGNHFKTKQIKNSSSPRPVPIISGRQGPQHPHVQHLNSVNSLIRKILIQTIHQNAAPQKPVILAKAGTAPSALFYSSFYQVLTCGILSPPHYPDSTKRNKVQQPIPQFSRFRTLL